MAPTSMNPLPPEPSPSFILVKTKSGSTFGLRGSDGVVRPGALGETPGLRETLNVGALKMRTRL